MYVQKTQKKTHRPSVLKTSKSPKSPCNCSYQNPNFISFPFHNMDEHVLPNDPALQLSLSTLQGNLDYVSQLAENSLYQQHNMVKAGDYGSYYVPQCIGYQQMPPYYFEYLAGNGISYKNTGTGCSYTPEDSLISMDTYQVRHSIQQHEEVHMNNLKNSQQEICYQEKGPNIPTKSCKKRVRDKTYSDTDRRRRTRIAAGLDALGDLLPQSKEGNKANIVDDCLDYIKYLQLQLKELSQNRLGSEPTSHHLMYFEGYGHYLVHENTNTVSESLQDLLGNLLKSNPSEATKLLESRDLFIMPISHN